MIYLFVLDDSFTSWRFTTRTEELSKCYEPLQKLRVRLRPCKIDLNPLCVTDRSKSILLWWFFLFYVLVFKIFLCCWRLMYVCIFLVKLR